MLLGMNLLETLALRHRNVTCVRHAISRVQHDTSCATRCIQGQYSLNGYIHCWHVECLKHDLGHLLPVGFRVERSLSEQDRVLLRCDSQFIVECVMPDGLHIIPIGHNPMLYWVLQGQNTTLGLCFISNKGILQKQYFFSGCCWLQYLV